MQRETRLVSTRARVRGEDCSSLTGRVCADEGIDVLLNPLTILVEEPSLGDSWASTQRVDVSHIYDLRTQERTRTVESRKRWIVVRTSLSTTLPTPRDPPQVLDSPRSCLRERSVTRGS